MSIVDTAKDLYDLLKKGATVELQERLMKLREEALELQEENHSLRERLSVIEREAVIAKNLLFEGGVYWRIRDDESKDGPFCQRCYDVDSRLVRVHSDRFGGVPPCWECKHCDKTYVKG